MWNACRPKRTFFSTKESRIFRSRKRLHAREGGHVITVISDCGEAVVYQIRASVPFLIVPLLQQTMHSKGLNELRFRSRYSSAFRSARGSLDRVPLVYHHVVVWFTKGMKGIKIRCRIEQKENEMKDRFLQ